jgi:hypothetical protein
MTDVYNKEKRVLCDIRAQAEKVVLNQNVFCDIREEAEETVDHRAGSTVMSSIDFLRGTDFNSAR